MRRSLVPDGFVLALLVLLAGCAREPAPAPAHGPLTGLLSLQNARCAACHALPGSLGEQLAMPAPPALEQLADRRPGAAAEPFLRGHFGADAAADIAAWVRSLGERPALVPADIDVADVARGERLVDEFGCGACHDVARFALAGRTDHARLTGWLREPTVAHVPLVDDEARAIATWLLRSTKQDGVAARGFAWQCYELKIDDGDWPDLGDREPVATGVADRIDTSVGTRKNHYALVFTAQLDVPADGEWEFATSSDDGSWLWIDGELVVDNAGLKPTTRKQGRVQLAAGSHSLRVAFTQGGGGAALKVLWSGPGVEEQELPADRATSSVARLVPPAIAIEEPDADAIQRGREAARLARCDRCHAVADAAFAALPAPPPPKAWTDLGVGTCVMPAGPAVHGEVRELPATLDDATRLQLSLSADGCLSCHRRDGSRGLPPAVAGKLVEVEDLGEEGRVPPDLTGVGRRLRAEWIERVVRDGHKVRDYVRMRMPAYGADKAARYARWFADVDAPGVIDEEPAFSADAVELGRKLAGTGGRNCISCHTIAGHASLGPQGMDLLAQHQRLRPGWFRDWLLKPLEMRPGTRMPMLWLTDTEQDQKEVDAIRSWLSLGASAPLPKGVVVDAGSYLLEPIERPVLHAAFLKDVSARSLAVGTPLRVHYAYDLDGARLAWLWRGAYLDARGTWLGRAGKLLEPLGEDWQVVDDFTVAGDGAPRLLGQRRTAEGYPVLRVRRGDVVYEDRILPELTSEGAQLVRTIRCEQGTLRLQFPAGRGYEVIHAGEPASTHEIAAGDAKEFTYRW